MSGFGDYIAARRKALKLTQKDVAARIKKEDGVAIFRPISQRCGTRAAQGTAGQIIGTDWYGARYSPRRTLLPGRAHAA